MTNYNERLNKIFYQYGRQVAESAADDWEKRSALTEFTKVDMTNHYTEAKQALTSLIKELVAEAKPKNNWLEGSDLSYGHDNGVEEFEQNLLKALEDKNAI